jgi:hypothetical protein
MPVKISSSDIDVTSGTEAVISNSGFLNALVQNNTDALQLLRDQVGPVYVSDVSVDSQGRVVIKNKAFAEKLGAKLGGGIGAAAAMSLGGLGCGGGCVN